MKMASRTISNQKIKLIGSIFIIFIIIIGIIFIVYLHNLKTYGQDNSSIKYLRIYKMNNEL